MPKLNHSPLTYTISIEEFPFIMAERQIEAWLQRYDIQNYTINEDLSVDVAGNVNLSLSSLTTIPVKFNNVLGNFNAENNQLIHLYFAPRYVKGNFDVSRNYLKSLEFGPEKVEGLSSRSK